MNPLKPESRLIALVSNSSWSVYNFRLEIIRLLQQDGFRILVIAPEDEFASDLRREGCIFQPIVFNNRTLNPFADLRFYRQLRVLYRQYKPAYIFHYVAKPNIYGSIAAHREGIPSAAVITGLGYAFHKENLLNRLICGLYRKALKCSTETWFLNKEDARFFLNKKLVEARKVKVLPGEGINTDFFSYNRPSGSRRFRFLMSTRLLRSKGVGLFADASRILQKKNYDVECRLIGFFESRHPDSVSQTELDAWQQEGLLSYGGFASDVRSELASADCFVFPSYYNEGVPRCLMEASAMGLPVITANNRGCREVVANNLSGFLCHINDPFDLADKMEKMILMKDADRRMMGINGRKITMEKFSVDIVYQEYLASLQILQGD